MPRAWSWLREVDWPLISIVAAFILMIPLFTVWVPPLSRLAMWLDASTISVYERAIMNAAVKTTAYEKAEPLLRPGSDRAQEVHAEIAELKDYVRHARSH